MFFANHLIKQENKLVPRLMLVLLTVVFILAQLLFAFVHFKFAGVVDALIGRSLLSQILHVSVLWPIGLFLFWQMLAYVLLIGWIDFISRSLTTLFDLTERQSYLWSIGLLMLAMIDLLSLNTYAFPGSFFAIQSAALPWLNVMPMIILISSGLLLLATLLAYIHYFKFKRYHLFGTILLILFGLQGLLALHDAWLTRASTGIAAVATKPSVIFIGFDSLRPDYLDYTDRSKAKTPHLDAFIKSSTYFANAYTPLARTFPSWVTMLTGRYPVHTNARNNLVDLASVYHEETLAKRLQAAGYATFYASDEKRFSNINETYGFDHVIGPRMGADDFLIGGLSDFPMTNLLLKLPGARLLFPFNYANRAAAVTYDPAHFLRLVDLSLPMHSAKPVFLAIHLCLSHWPYTWARDGQTEGLSNAQQYIYSVQGVDQQFAALQAILRKKGLLAHAIVVILSDHGTALGMPGDRFITTQNYQGDPDKLPLVTTYQLSGLPVYKANFSMNYSISTAYGQGTDVLSFPQNHVLLAFKGYGVSIPVQTVTERMVTVNLAPTILGLLHLPAMKGVDGISMQDYLQSQFAKTPGQNMQTQPLFLETGDKFGAIETDKIAINKVIEARLGAYAVDPKTGFLYLQPAAEASLIQNKQRAVWWGDWILVLYPPHIQQRIKSDYTTGAKMAVTSFVRENEPAYFILANVKTGAWTVGLSSPLAKSAPVPQMLAALQQFYGNELIMPAVLIPKIR